MGDFVGGMLKYIRDHPVPRVTVAGGVAKMTKLAQGMLDVHSKRGVADLDALAQRLPARPAPMRRWRSDPQRQHGGRGVRSGRRRPGSPLGDAVAERAWQTAAGVLADPEIALEILIFDRDGVLDGAHAPVPRRTSSHPSRPRKRRW